MISTNGLFAGASNFKTMNLLLFKMKKHQTPVYDTNPGRGGVSLVDLLAAAMPGLVLYDLGAERDGPLVLTGRMLASGAVSAAMTVQLSHQGGLLTGVYGNEKPMLIMGASYLSARASGLSGAKAGVLAAAAYVLALTLVDMRSGVGLWDMLVRHGGRGRVLPSAVHGDVTRDRRLPSKSE